MGFWKFTQEHEAELAAIRAKALADARAIKEAIQPGYKWVIPWHGQAVGWNLTCETCGAVVTLDTQQAHSTWHDSLVTDETLRKAYRTKTYR